MDNNHQVIVNLPHNDGEDNNSENGTAVIQERAKVAMQNAPVVNHEKTEMVIPDIETHRTSLLLAERHLPKERIKNIKDELAHIDEIENTQTIEMRREFGTLPKEFTKTEFALVAEGINPGLLTVEEAQGLHNYASNADKDIIERKTETIANAIARIRNGGKNRRDWSFNPRKAECLDRLTAKYERYERGEIDTECGFDKAHYLESENKTDRDYYFADAYNRAVIEEGERPDDYSNQAYSRFINDMGVDGYYERVFEDMTAEELLEEGIIEEDDLFVYGPYTHRDLKEDYEIFKVSTWVDTTNFRDKSNVATILQESVINRNNSTESDLLREYVATEILPNRRPTPKNALSLFSALGIEFAEKSTDELESAMPKEKADELRDNLSWASYYASKILGMRAEELKEEYGSTRPTSKKFFEEVLARSEAITEQQEKWMKKSVGPYLTKFDERMFAAEALYEPILSSEGGDGKDFEGLALPGDLFAPEPEAGNKNNNGQDGE